MSNYVASYGEQEILTVDQLNGLADMYSHMSEGNMTHEIDTETGLVFVMHTSTPKWDCEVTHWHIERNGSIVIH